MSIRILNATTINKIAAGEVVDRPLSVVKELVENAIDAKATKIVINLKKGGRSLISVSDNGVGIERDELCLALTRHATSKLNEDDFTNILFMGFRGEALASIATAARVKITSRTGNSEHGWSVSVDDGPKIMNEPLVVVELQPAKHQQGTTVEVCDLFCFMPNRIRFLKSEQFEIVTCVEMLQGLAIANENIAIQLIHDDREIFETGKKINESGNLEYRIQEILSTSFIENAIFFDTDKEHEGTRLYGYVSVPTHSRNKANKLFTFVNKRLIKDNFLNKVIRAAYFNTIPNEYHPAIVLFIEVHPKSVDVNVHPSKAEVRFSDEKLIRGLIIQSIRDAISKAKTSTTLNENILQRQENISPTVQQSGQPTNQSFFKDKFENAFLYEREPFPSIEKNVQPAFKFETTPIISPAPQEQPILKKKSLGEAIHQIGLRYVLAVNDNGLVLVDQHAAHERIVLQKNLKNLVLPSQKLLIPMNVDFGTAHNDALLSISETLEKISITIKKSENGEIIINTVPIIQGGFDIVPLLQDIANDIESHKETVEWHIEKLYSKISCYSSIRAGRKLDKNEMDSLLRMIEEVEFGSQCNHGRPTYIELPLSYLDRMFERI